MEAARPSPWQRLARSRARFVLAAAVPLVVYGAALNPYYPPENYDDILYVEAARSIATDGSYAFAGHQVADWPPALSALLSVPFLLGVGSLWIAKLLVLICAALGSVLALVLLERTRAPLPLATVLVAALLPNALLMGSRVMSEQPFLAASFAFLVALDRIHDVPETGRAHVWRRALGAGALLGVAALTRSVGVLLGIAVVVQAISRARAAERGARLRAVLPEVSVAVVGALAVLAWRAHVWHALRTGAAVSRYQRDASFLGHFDPLGLVRNVGDLLGQASRIGAAIGLPPIVLDVALVALVLFILFGVVTSLRNERARPAIGYMLATLALFTCLEWKVPRYLLPVAPLLVSQVIVAGARLGHASSRRAVARVVGFSALGVWALVLLAMDGVLIVRGNGKNHRGLSPLASPTAESFYVGYWRDLYRASRWAGAAPGPGSIALAGRSDCRYVRVFSGRDCADRDVAPPDARFVMGLTDAVGPRLPDDRSFGTFVVRARRDP